MIVTFYSYKGGTGRTLALANIAALLASRGKRVLAIDFDLEAPGLWRYFSRLRRDLDKRKGLIDLLVDASSAELASDVDWKDYVTPVPVQSTSLWLMTSGQLSENYPSKVLDFDWTEFFRSANGGDFLEGMRNQWLEEYDFTLVDSRTGITDTGGICTIMLPDLIVPVFVSNQQSLDGVVDVITRAQARRNDLAYDRPPAAILPLLSRFDSRTEFESAQEWLDISADRLGKFYADWLPRELEPRQALEKTKLPYVAYFSFGETLPTLTQGVSDPDSLGYALNTVSHLIEAQLGNARAIIGGSSPGESLLNTEAVTDYGDAAGARPGTQRHDHRVPVISAAEWAWQRQSVWSQTADKLKTAPSRARTAELILIVVAAALALAGSQLKEVSAPASLALGVVAAVTLAAVGLLRAQTSTEQVQRWTQARAVSEMIKTEVFTYLTGTGRYEAPDKETLLAAETQRLEYEAADLSPYNRGVQPVSRSLPPVHDLESYLQVRVRDSQLKGYYDRNATILESRIRQLKVAQIALALGAAALAAVASIAPSVAAWAAVATTAIGAVTAYNATQRYEFLWIEYSRTASKLRRLLDLRTADDGTPLSRAELVAECEHVISATNLEALNQGSYSRAVTGSD